MASLTRKIAEGTFFFIFEKFFTNGLAVISSFLIIKILGQYDYGLLVLILSIVAMASGFLDFGLGLVISSDLAIYRGQNQLAQVKKLIKDFFWSQIIMGLFLTSFIFLLSIFIVNSDKIKLLIIVGLGILSLNALKNVFLTIIYGFTFLKTMAIIKPLEMFLKIFFILFFSFFWSKGVIGVLFSQFLASFILTMIAGLISLKIYFSLRMTKSSSNNILFEIIKNHGKWQMLTAPIKDVFENIRFWVVSYFLGINAVAIFRVADQLINYILQVVVTIEGVLLPVISEIIDVSHKLAKKIMVRSIKYSLWLSLIVGMISFFAVPFFLTLLFGDKYSDSILLFEIMLLLLPLSAFGVAFRPLFFSLRKQKVLFKIYLISDFFAYIFSILVIILFRFNGFVIPLGSCISGYLRYNYLTKFDQIFKIQLKEFFIFDDYDMELIQKIIIKIKNKFS